MGSIYGLHSGDGIIRYVGLTKNKLIYRLKQHRAAANGESHLPVHHWMRKHDPATIKIVQLEETDIDLGLREIWWIAELRHRGANLMNVSPGGDTWGGYSVLSPEQVRTLREEYFSSSLSSVRLAQKYDLRPQTVYNALSGNHWPDAGGPILRLGSGVKGERNGSAKLSLSLAGDIRGDRSAGATLKELSHKYGVSISQIHSVVHNKSWTSG